MPISSLAKEQIGRPGLWVVATPIGNLNDLTNRAIAALAHADVIFCEDTRVAQKLLHFLEIPKKKLVRLDAHTEIREIQQWVLKISETPTFHYALVTDAGTPAISDPGSALVRAAQDAEISVTPIPGPSAVTTLLSVSGFQATRFTFCGFFPRKSGERESLIERIQMDSQSQVATYVWFESPERIEETLELVCQFFPQSLLSVGKELTKMHEKTTSGTSQEVLARMRQWKEKDADCFKGEWVFALNIELKETILKEEKTWLQTLQCLVECRVSTSDATASILKYFDAHKKEVYDQALLFKKIIEGGVDQA